MVFLIRDSQNRPSFPLLIPAEKFMSSSTRSILSSRRIVGIRFGEEIMTVRAKYFSSNSSRAFRMLLLSSTTRMVPCLPICVPFSTLIKVSIITGIRLPLSKNRTRLSKFDRVAHTFFQRPYFSLTAKHHSNGQENKNTCYFSHKFPDIVYCNIQVIYIQKYAKLRTD